MRVILLLSMGAAFTLFGAVYFWMFKITGCYYSEILGKLHFFLMFLGVNVTFFPMHFLGLAGMPRRIPDYPDAYADWNAICSYGSIITSLGTFIFFLNVYLGLIGYWSARKNRNLYEF